MASIFTAVDMFAGAGGAATGLRAAGFRSLADVEMWDAAVATLAAAGHHPIEGRVEDPAVVAEVRRRVGNRRLDLLWASPPCQPYSSSGLRLGKLDPRDGWGATVMYARLLRPRAVIVENVRDAPVGEWAEAIKEATRLPHAGSFKLTASDFGVPQVRLRAFVYAGPAPLSTFLSEVARHKRPARSVADVLPYLKGHYVRSEQTTARARTTEQACATIPTKGNLYIHKVDVGTRKVGYRRDPEVSRLATPEETAALTGFPEGYPLFGGVKARYKLVGNSVAPAVAEAIGLAVKSLLERRT